MLESGTKQQFYSSGSQKTLQYLRCGKFKKQFTSTRTKVLQMYLKHLQFEAVKSLGHIMCCNNTIKYIVSC